MKAWIRRGLASAGYFVFNTRSPECYARDGLFTAHDSSFREEPRFKEAYARGVKASRGVDPGIEWRVHVALWSAANAVRAPGPFVECGVNAGFTSSAIMQRLDWRDVDKTFYLIDTFQGPVLTQYSAEEVAQAAAAEDALRRGAYVTDLDRVRDNYREWPNVEIVQGAVPEVLPALGIDRVAFLHLDMNCAFPEAAALRHFWPLLSPGAMALLDDYSYFGNHALKRAIDSAARSLGVEVLSLPTGQGLILR
ncbi:MAG: class I SAM-dependent methyltransferase [Acidobacteria bacterium]|nr:class I SAM-dependent methyltransferase [Acidobacteriota bacterium]